MKHKVIALTNHIDHAKILDEVSDPLVVLNSDYQFTYANKAFAQALGKTLEVIIGNDLWGIYQKDGADFRRDVTKEVFETGQTKVVENVVPKPSGNLYFITTFKPIFNEQNIVISVVAIAKDVTDRKQAEEALKVSELEYRNQANFLDTVAENGPFAMWVSDAEGTMIRANQSLRNILNLTNDMLIGKYNVLHDENLDAQGLMPIVEAVFNDLKSARFTMFWTGTKAGDVDLSIANELWIDVSMFPITDEVGKLVNVVCQYVDITERKQAEEALQESEHYLKEAQGIAHVGSWRWEIIPDEIYWSDETYRLFSWEPGEEIDFEKYIDAVLPVDRDFVSKEVKDALDGIKLYENEHRIVRNGEVRIHHTKGEVTKDEQGKPIRMVGIVQDITERKQAEEAGRGFPSGERDDAQGDPPPGEEQPPGYFEPAGSSVQLSPG